MEAVYSKRREISWILRISEKNCIVGTTCHISSASVCPDHKKPRKMKTTTVLILVFRKFSFFSSFSFLPFILLLFFLEISKLNSGAGLWPIKGF